MQWYMNIGEDAEAQKIVAILSNWELLLNKKIFYLKVPSSF